MGAKTGGIDTKSRPTEVGVLGLMAARDTRQGILEAATDLFGLRGVDAVSLDLIAAEVGVAKQTLLYWFPSKDDLVQAVLVQAATQLGVAIEGLPLASSQRLPRNIDGRNSADGRCADKHRKAKYS